ncbi:MAG: hypothetical protein ACREIA_19900 [Opitutaceae bacterium]
MASLQLALPRAGLNPADRVKVLEPPAIRESVREITGALDS